MLYNYNLLIDRLLIVFLPANFTLATVGSKLHFLIPINVNLNIIYSNYIIDLIEMTEIKRPLFKKKKTFPYNRDLVSRVTNKKFLKNFSWVD
jgi:hypothetical protein